MLEQTMVTVVPQEKFVSLHFRQVNQNSSPLETTHHKSQPPTPPSPKKPPMDSLTRDELHAPNLPIAYIKTQTPKIDLLTENTDPKDTQIQTQLSKSSEPLSTASRKHSNVLNTESLIGNDCSQPPPSLELFNDSSSRDNMLADSLEDRDQHEKVSSFAESKALILIDDNIDNINGQAWPKRIVLSEAMILGTRHELNPKESVAASTALAPPATFSVTKPSNPFLYGFEEMKKRHLAREAQQTLLQRNFSAGRDTTEERFETMTITSRTRRMQHENRPFNQTVVTVTANGIDGENYYAEFIVPPPSSANGTDNQIRKSNIRSWNTPQKTSGKSLILDNTIKSAYGLEQEREFLTALAVSKPDDELAKGFAFFQKKISQNKESGFGKVPKNKFNNFRRNAEHESQKSQKEVISLIHKHWNIEARCQWLPVKEQRTTVSLFAPILLRLNLERAFTNGFDRYDV